MRRPELPFTINAAIATAGALLLAHSALGSNYLQPSVSTVVERGGTRTFVSTAVITRKIRGKIVHRDSKVYVTVPVIRVHVDHRTITVAAQRLPLRSASATVAAHANVTVYIPVPETTFVPTTVTSTETIQLPPSTTTITVPTTITLPLIPTTSDQ